MAVSRQKKSNHYHAVLERTRRYWQKKYPAPEPVDALGRSFFGIYVRMVPGMPLSGKPCDCKSPDDCHDWHCAIWTPDWYASWSINEVGRMVQDRDVSPPPQLSEEDSASYPIRVGPLSVQDRLALSGKLESQECRRLRRTLDQEQASIFERREAKACAKRVARRDGVVVRRWNSGPDSVPIVRDGRKPARHYDDDGGTIERKVRSYLWRAGRPA